MNWFSSAVSHTCSFFPLLTKIPGSRSTGSTRKQSNLPAGTFIFSRFSTLITNGQIFDIERFRRVLDRDRRPLPRHAFDGQLDRVEIGLVDACRVGADLEREFEHGVLARADVSLAMVHRHLVGHQRLLLVDAQDRAVRETDSELLAFSDANATWAPWLWPTKTSSR